MDIRGNPEKTEDGVLSKNFLSESLGDKAILNLWKIH